MADRTTLIAWGAACLAHVIAALILLGHKFDRPDVRFDLVSIDLAMIAEPQAVEDPVLDVIEEVPEETPVIPPEPVVPVETPLPEPDTPDIVETIDPREPARAPAPNVTRRIVTAPPVRAPSRSVPYAETPPGPVQQTLRAFQCARLTPSQRANCPTNDEDDEFISAIVAEAKAAQPIYDPVLNVYRTRTLLDRIGNGPVQPGAFSVADNPSHLPSDASSDAATAGLATRLNANPDPLFDGG